MRDPLLLEAALAFDATGFEHHIDHVAPWHVTLRELLRRWTGPPLLEPPTLAMALQPADPGSSLASHGEHLG
jgi:hypothetical protein